MTAAASPQADVPGRAGGQLPACAALKRRRDLRHTRPAGAWVSLSVVDLSFSDTRLAALYDRLHPLSEPERGFYLPIIMQAGSVLDVGCGTGALLHAARRAGHVGRLCGLDPAAAMLARARARPDIEWLCGDLAATRYADEFDLVVMTGHAFQTLVEDHEVRAALAAVRGALRAHGRFVFETRNPSARAWEGWTSRTPTEVLDATGTRVQVSRRVETPFDGRTVCFSETFVGDGWERSLTSRSTLRFLDATALSGFLGEARLAIEAQFGDYSRQPLTPASPEIITLARVAA